MKTYEIGERRVYRRIDIRYDGVGWYIDMYILETIGRNPPGKKRWSTRRIMFNTIAEAKRYIDHFED